MVSPILKKEMCPMYRTRSVHALGALALLGAAAAANAQTVAYWRFEDGVAGTDVFHSTPDGFFEASIFDVSGNGNHLSVWTQGGCCGYTYRDSVSANPIPNSGDANILSVKNSGGGPGMFTNSLIGVPGGVDIELMTPAQWTVEASFKPENGGYRTVVGRDAQFVAGNGALAALYLQMIPGDAMAIVFVDVSGFEHRATSKPGLIHGFDWPSDPDGLLGTWYNAVATSDGTTLSLYVDNNLVASTNIAKSGSPDTSLARGFTDGGDWHAGEWSVGRGLYGGGHTDRAYGYIDEVRISNVALTPDQFLFASGKPTCRADFNHDTVVNSQDFFDFLTAFFSNDPSSDFNHDTILNSQDFFDFLTAFFAGC
jgi:hypothetical protein